MASYSRRRITASLDRAAAAVSADAKGAELETLIGYVFAKIRGVSLYDRNVLDGNRAHEIDLVFFNSVARSELSFLDPVIFVECKHTGQPSGSHEVGWFIRKLQDRGATAGVFVALSGITGQADGVSNAHSEVLSALVRDRIKILVLTRDELLSLDTTQDLLALLKEKYMRLVLYKTVR
jgi:hypothetical protein